VGKTVAVIGASNDRRKFGNRAVRAFLAEGYTVFPVNSHETSVEGVAAYKSVLDVPGSIDMATVYVPPEVGRTLLSEFARKGIAEVWFNPGSESDRIAEEGRQLGLNVVFACSIIGMGRLAQGGPDTGSPA